MSTMSQAATRPAMSLTSGGFSRRVGTWFGTWVYVLVDHLHRRSAIKTLREMNERELRDIGLTRSQIEDAVSGLANPDVWRIR